MILKKKKDLYNRKLFKKFEIKNLITKFIVINLISNPNLLDKFKTRFIFFKKRSLKHSKVRINGRCILTNRKGGIFRKFSISRIVLRDLFQFGIIPGFKKAVW